MVKERKSPSESATLFEVNTIKKGNDGNEWIIIETKNKVKRWKLVKNKTKLEYNDYFYAIEATADEYQEFEEDFMTNYLSNIKQYKHNNYNENLNFLTEKQKILMANKLYEFLEKYKQSLYHKIFGTNNVENNEKKIDIIIHFICKFNNDNIPSKLYKWLPKNLRVLMIKLLQDAQKNNSVVKERINNLSKLFK